MSYVIVIACHLPLQADTVLLTLVGRSTIQLRLQLFQSLQVELLIPALGLSRPLPQFVSPANNVYFGRSSHANGSRSSLF